MFYHVEIKTLGGGWIGVTNVSMGDIAKRYFYPFEMGEAIDFYGHRLTKADCAEVRLLASGERIELDAQALFAPDLDLEQLEVGRDRGPVWEVTEEFFGEIRGFVERFEQRRTELDDHSLLKTEAPAIWTRPKNNSLA
ncbi:MAG: hypothetical protein RRB13_04420 [bacterium]|nr:hypothetical protein [bacterium]